MPVSLLISRTVVALGCLVSPLACASTQAPTPPATVESAPSSDAAIVDATILLPMIQGESAIVLVNRGNRDGIAVGDEARIPCEESIGKVSEVYEFRSRFVIARSAYERRPANKRARITLHGEPSVVWCP